ncbi:MAG: hypothetical protein IPL99_08150 [Candidatus Competibacteraceae bacterium]|nr:hypothetical protein [Candidatus Competibacteraceae bacterium]
MKRWIEGLSRFEDAEDEVNELAHHGTDDDHGRLADSRVGWAPPTFTGHPTPPKWRAMPALLLFAEIGFACLGFSTAPIRRIYPLRHIPMERGIRPITDLCDVTVLHRIPMDVINMAVEIVPPVNFPVIGIVGQAGKMNITWLDQ